MEVNIYSPIIQGCDLTLKTWAIPLDLLRAEYIAGESCQINTVYLKRPVEMSESNFEQNFKPLQNYILEKQDQLKEIMNTALEQQFFFKQNLAWLTENIGLDNGITLKGSVVYYPLLQILYKDSQTLMIEKMNKICACLLHNNDPSGSFKKRQVKYDQRILLLKNIQPGRSATTQNSTSLGTTATGPAFFQIAKTVPQIEQPCMSNSSIHLVSGPTNI